nr:hypothetical protein [Tanacetum cinerariifolium]
AAVSWRRSGLGRRRPPEVSRRDAGQTGRAPATGPRLDRAHHPMQESGQRDLQQAGIEFLATVGLHEAAQLRIKPFAADVGMDFVSDLAVMQASLALFRMITLRQHTGVAIKRNPRHDLGVSKVPRLGT